MTKLNSRTALAIALFTGVTLLAALGFQNMTPSLLISSPKVTFQKADQSKSVTFIGNRKNLLNSSIAGEHLQVDEFLGIQYSHKPLGENRWTDTGVLSPFDLNGAAVNLVNAKTLKSACPQESLKSLEDIDAIEDIVSHTSEDCLYLNIWRPSPEHELNQKLPVLVWFHGGGFVRNSIRHPKTFGDILASHGVIVVTVDYRLGALGFFGFPRMNEGQELTGNYGLIDMINSLKWVKENISHFGGDDQNVTIFGTSAGGASVNTLMTSPYIRSLPQPLFHKVISESGGGAGQKIPVLQSQDPSGLSAQKVGLRLWNALLNDPTVLCKPNFNSKYYSDFNDRPLSDIVMQSALAPINVFKICVSSEDIIKKTGLQAAGGEFRAYPFIDGKIVSETPILESFRYGKTVPVPYIGGSAVDESSLIRLRDVDFDQMVCNLLIPKAPINLLSGDLADTFSKKVRAIAELYDVQVTNDEAFRQSVDYQLVMRRFFSDMQFSLPSQLLTYYQNRRLVSEFANSDLGAYSYEYGYLTEAARSSVLSKISPALSVANYDYLMSAAGHSQESFAVFGKLEHLLGNIDRVSRQDQIASLEVIQRWISFAKTSSPNSPAHLLDSSSSGVWRKNENITSVFRFVSTHNRATNEMGYRSFAAGRHKRTLMRHFIDVFKNPSKYSNTNIICE